jgi:hypothetical protein
MKIYHARILSIRPNSIDIRVLYLLLLIVLAACYPSVNPADLQAAKAGVETTLDQVPPPDFVTVIRTVPEDFDDSEYVNWGDQVCAIARRWVIIVSSRPQDDVVETYVTELETLGFQRKGAQYAHSATLYRDSRDFANIGFLTAGAWYSSFEEYEHLHQMYPTVMQLQLHTVRPNPPCGHLDGDALRDPYFVPTVTPRPHDYLSP